MIVPFSAADFLDRALAVYAERIGIVDEPDQPAESLGDLTYARVGELARAQAAKLDELGIGVGDRVAYVSHNSARLFTAFFGVTGFGRVLVPINFRLSADEVAYIVEHSGARVLYVDPELEDALADVECEHKFVIGDDEDMYVEGRDPEPWEHDENATATINYTSGTTARPKGVQITHRNIWTNAVTFALHTGVTDRDVYLHTLPMFHANGWGMPFAMTGMGVPQVVLRKIDGAEILRRVEKHGVTVMCAAPAVVASVLDAAETWEGEIPGRDQVRIIVAGAPPPTKTVARVEAELGWEFIQIYGLTETSPLLTINRTRAEWDDLVRRGARRASWSAPASPPSASRSRSPTTGEVLARSNVVLEGYWEQPEETEAALGRRLVPHRRRRRHRRRRLPDHPGPQEGRDHHRRRERLVDRGRGRDLLPPRRRRGRRDRRARREVGRDDQGARGEDRGLRAHRAGADRLLQVARWRASRRRRRWSSARCWPARRPASCRSSSCASRTGRAGTGRSTRPTAR